VIRLAASLGFAQAGFHAWIASIPVAMAAVGRPDPEIGLVVGSAAVANLLAALASGGLIDRFGGRAAYLVGTLVLFAGAAPIALGLVGAASDSLELILLRALQGIGLAIVLPSVMMLVPGQVPRRRLPTALAVVGVAGNVSLAVTPATSLALLSTWGLPAVGLAVCLSVAGGAVLLWPVRDHEREAMERRPTAFRPAWRRSWLAPVLTTILFIAHWGVVTAYLPQRAQAAGADIGLFFTADALGLLALRVPAGWLAGRIGSRPLIIVGVLVTLVGVALILPPPETWLLVVAGLLCGAGSAFFFPVMALELTFRSDVGTRGSAFALYGLAFGAGIALGSLAVAPIYPLIGFDLALLGGLALVAVAGAIALLDGDLAPPGRAEALTTPSPRATPPPSPSVEAASGALQGRGP
jgi:MFS family permease